MENEAFASKEEMLNFPQNRSVPILPRISFAVYVGRALTSQKKTFFFLILGAKAETGLSDPENLHTLV